LVETAIIGIGKMGISHLSLLNTNPDVKIVGVCDKSGFVLDAFKKLSNFNCYNSYEELYEIRRPSCVIIATPTNTHFEITKYFVEKGINVFVEKPFGFDYQSGLELTHLAKEKGVENQVGYHNRFVSTFNYAKKILDENILGDIYHFYAEVNGPAFIKESKISWRAKNTEGGGCLLDYGSHLLNLVNYFFGLPVKVTGPIFKKIFSVDSEDAVFSNLVFNNNLSGNISVNWSEKTYRRMSIVITILGKKGKVVVESQECKIYLTEDYKKENLNKGWNFKYITDLTKPVNFFVRGEEYSNQLDYFVSRIKDKPNSKNINSFENSITTNLVIDMIKRDALWS
jgi:predicted dehydrogenase